MPTISKLLPSQGQKPAVSGQSALASMLPNQSPTAGVGNPPAGLKTMPDSVNGLGVPVNVLFSKDEPGMRFNVNQNGQAELHANINFSNDKEFVRQRSFRAIEDWLWPYDKDVYVRAHDKKDDYDHLKSGTHRGSKNHATGDEEGGLSVARDVEAGYSHSYLVRGKKIGTGTDSEPLLDAHSAQVVSPRMKSFEFRKKLKQDILSKLAGIGIGEREYRAIVTSPRFNFSPDK